MNSSNDHVYLFVHLPKSAGSSINKHANKHFSQTQRITLSPELLGEKRHQTKKVLYSTKQYFKTLPKNKRRQLKYVTGHYLENGVHRQINQDKKPYYFTFLRDPAARIASIYNYFRQWYEQDQSKNKKYHELYQQLFLIDNKQPEFIDWYQQKYQPSQNNFPVPSSIAFYQQLGYLKTGKLTGGNIKDFFNQFLFVGLVEHFKNDAAFIYHQLGINKFFIKQNISKKYFELSKHPQILETLKKELSTEYQLYDAAIRHRQEFIHQYPEYKQIVNQVQKKQQLIRPFTQVIFDWPDNLGLISKKMRQYLPGYGILLDHLKTN